MFIICFGPRLSFDYRNRLTTCKGCANAVFPLFPGSRGDKSAPEWTYLRRSGLFVTWGATSSTLLEGDSFLAFSLGLLCQN